MKKLIVPVLLLTLLLKCGFAQQGNTRFDHFTIADGLPERQVQFIGQDSRGYMWAGTQNGLVKYDGYHIKVYRFPVDSHFISISSSIRSMVEDNNHVLWFSTVGNGLYRYNLQTDDFTKFAYIPPDQKPVLYYGYLLMTDYKNNLWGYLTITSGKAIFFKFDTKTGKYELYNPGDIKKVPAEITTWNSIIQTKNKQIWLSANSGLYAYNYAADQFIQYFKTTNLSTSYIYQAPSDTDHLWMGMGNDKGRQSFIRRLNVHDKTFKDYIPHNSPGLTRKNDTTTDTYEDKKQRLWFASNYGLMLFNRDKETFTDYLPADTDRSPEKNVFNNIRETKKGTFWISTEKGMMNFNPETHLFYHYTNNPADPYSISSNNIQTYAEAIDRTGLLWLGFSTTGFDKENPQVSHFTSYVHNPAEPNGYPGSRPFKIKNMGNGGVLFSCKTGIYSWMPGTNKFIPVYKATTEPYVACFDTDKDGNIYFENENGFNIYHIKTRKLETIDKSPVDNTSFRKDAIQEIIVDHAGLVWIGLRGYGVFTYDIKTRQFRHLSYITNDGITKPPHGELDDNTPIIIFEDRDYNIWIGTNLGGINKYNRNTGKFQSFLYDGPWHVWCIDQIYQDRQGRLWLGTYLDGLFLFNPKTNHFEKQYNESSGLLFNTISGLVQDKDGFIWTSGDRGLSRLNPNTGAVKLFPVKTILPNISIRSSYHNFLAWDDTFIMGTSNGIVTFDPNELKGNPYPPQVNVESIAYNNPRDTGNHWITKYIFGLKDVELPWNQNRITFNYIALHFVNPQENKYAYYLEGYDKNWITAGNQRSASYTNLSPGTYIFHVKAANSDGVWNNKGESLTVVINSPWWSTWWAWLLYVIAFVLLVYAIIAYRSRKLREDNRLLEEKVELRTHQLNEANRDLEEQKEEVLSQRDELSKTLENLKATQNQLVQSEKMASLGELTAGIAHEIQNPLNFVNNFSEVSAELLEEMEEDLDKGDIEEAKAISADIKQNLEKINQHGKRADGIVKGMLQHSRASSTTKEQVDINKLANEYLRLAYHGWRAKDKSFNADLVTNFDDELPAVNLVPQDIGRVLLNLFNNAFYAVQQRQSSAGTDYKPTVTVTTFRSSSRGIGISMKDNGTGIPAEIRDKILQPFFTTKPTGQGTGLGLSLSYDIVTKGHGGKIDIKSNEGEFTEFIISLPLN